MLGFAWIASGIEERIEYWLRGMGGMEDLAADQGWIFGLWISSLDTYKSDLLSRRTKTFVAKICVFATWFLFICQRFLEKNGVIFGPTSIWCILGGKWALLGKLSLVQVYILNRTKRYSSKE